MVTAERPGEDEGTLLDELRAILSDPVQRRLTDLDGQVDELRRRVEDREALVATLKPVMGEAIRQAIRDSRQEMIEALYPIIGQLVVRAVSEAIRDLARTIDARMRKSFDLTALWRRLRARISGVSQAELALREALPFQVTQIFLIHRDSGLLLSHLAREPAAATDSDLIGGMLTAIRDFAADAFGRGQEGQLDEIQYGDRRILIEAARHAYLAVVVEGVEPPGFRAVLRERVIEVQHRYGPLLADYDGDASRLAGTDALLRSLLVGA